MSEIISELQKIAVEAQKTFGNLSPEQINWKPSAEGWSVAQCFDHLIKSNEAFEPAVSGICRRQSETDILAKLFASDRIFRKFSFEISEKRREKIQSTEQGNRSAERYSGGYNRTVCCSSKRTLRKNEITR